MIAVVTATAWGWCHDGCQFVNIVVVQLVCPHIKKHGTGGDGFQTHLGDGVLERALGAKAILESCYKEVS